MSTEVATLEEPAQNVVQALARVIRDLPAIGKDGRADPKQGGYAYRGIEQITRAAAPLFARHGVIFTPHRIIGRETVDITVNAKPWTDEKMTVLWRVYGPGGREDFIEVETPAIGRDNADKGANKCMSQAFKYALLSTLCISDAKDDNDGSHTERDSLPPAQPHASKRQVDAFKARIEALDADHRSEFVAWKNAHDFLWPWTIEALEAMEAQLVKIVGVGVPTSEASVGDDALPGTAAAPTPTPSAGDPGEPDEGTGNHLLAASPGTSSSDEDAF